MAKVTAFFRGSGGFYEKGDGLWRILYPFDDCHTVRFKLSEEEKGISLAAPGREIRIKVENPVSRFEIGERFDDFLDLTSEVAHKDGVKLKDAEQPEGVLILVENAKLSVGEHTSCRFQLLQSKTDNILTAPKEIAYSAKIEIEGEKIIIEADGAEDFPRSFEQGNVEIIFDNTCPPTEDEEDESNVEPISDLALLYTLIEDVNDPKKTLTIARDPAQMPGALIINPASFAGSRRLDNVRPGEKGLPCNIVKISKPTNMR